MHALLMALRDSWEKNCPELHAVVTGGVPAFVWSRRTTADLRSYVPVFCYHVADPRGFEKDLEFLASNNYVMIDADALLAHVTGVGPAPPKSVVLTVDDGSRNLFEVVFPLLQRYGMRAVAFIAPGLHADKAPAVSGDSVDGLPCTWSEIERMHRSECVDFMRTRLSIATSRGGQRP